MAVFQKDRDKAQFGDFQTPPELAAKACSLLKARGLAPASIVEPTCGYGSFLAAALNAFPQAQSAIGADINANYIASARGGIANCPDPQRVQFRCQSFFATPWQEIFAELPEQILVIGNPPWVTNAHLGTLVSDNLPAKTNFQKYSGFDAVTGKSNFDISEWMLIHQLQWLQKKRAVVAMLCKTAVARKVMNHAWKNGFRVHDASIYLINASAHFATNVDACFFICHTDGNHTSYDCRVFSSLESTEPTHIFGYRDKQLVAEVEIYDRWKHLQGEERYKWRSGIKHDCSGVMELKRVGNQYENSLGKLVSLEPDYLYPMLKSSDIANGNVTETNRFMLVPQRSIGEQTDSIEHKAPLTWAYLNEYAPLLDLRGSSIYKNRPRFSVFGIGPYSFAPWKIAISGFYKSLVFRVVGRINGKPTVLDDTVNFISCQTQDEADSLAALLNSDATAQFFKGMIFWDAKRPLTIDLLKRIDLLRVAEVSGMLADVEKFIKSDAITVSKKRSRKLSKHSELFTEA